MSFRVAFFAAVSIAFTSVVATTADPPPPARVTGEPAVVVTPEVLNRGPIHEAYAIPASRNPVKTPIIEKTPPEPIDERPPARQPEGTSIRWVPGYWAFDEDLNDFIWISGIWREVPQGRTWVPGYWTNVEAGFLWVTGNWADAEVDQLSYLPEPPPSREIGPSNPNPGEGYFWIPGNWEFIDSQYTWRAGYWAPRQRDWIWVPARYTHSPVGCIYTSGYWDDLLSYRGVAFAPVYFRNPQGRITYTPSVALDAWQFLTLHLFVGSRRASYYFGDYNGTPYLERGYVPFFRTIDGENDDPLFAYYQWRFGPDYEKRLISWHKFFAEHEALRPRRTYAAQLDFASHHPDDQTVVTTTLVSPFEEIYHADRTPLKFSDFSKEQAVETGSRLQRLQEFAAERRDVQRIWKAGDERPGIPIRASKFLDRPWENEEVRLKPRTPDLPDQMKDIQPDDRSGRRARVPSRIDLERGTPPERAMPRYPTTPPGGSAILP